MRITKYRTELNEQRHNILVKESSCNYEIDSLSSPQKVFQLLTDLYGLNQLAEEYLYMIALSTKNKPLGIFEVSHGTVNASLVNPREIFIRLLLSGASNFILAHNHPSGSCTPSNEDCKLTDRINDCARLMGIPLLDHIIIGDDYLSYKEKGLLD